MNRGLPALLLTLALTSPLPSHAAPEVESCPADRYEPCASFSASVALGQHEPIIDNHVAGFTRSEGSWTISVRYQPETKCARVNILVDMGPVDVPRQYREGLQNGAGAISDSGTFMHRLDEPEAGLGILHSSCQVPGQESSRADDTAGSDEVPDEAERERLALEAEWERLALEREREQLALELEQERLALERERLARQQELEADREFLARELSRRLAEQERERERIARQHREQEEFDLAGEIEELERLLAQQDDEWEREDSADGSDGDVLADIITGLGIGALVGAAATGDAETYGATADAFGDLMATVHGFPGGTGVAAGSGCEDIGVRLSRELDALNASSSMCGMYRGYAQALRQARGALAAQGCATARELTDMDQAIREAEAGAWGSC